jgi:hypothetical protein
MRRVDDARRSRLLLGVALAMALWVAAGSGLWTGTYDAALHAGDDYQGLRTERAFASLPIGAIARRLDEILPRDVPVALAPGLAKNDGLTQRPVEGLYPRRVDRRAADVLTLARDGTVKTPLPDPARPVATKPEARESFAYDVGGLVGDLYVDGLVASVVSLVKIEGAVAAAGLSLCPFLLPVVHRAWLTCHRVNEFQADVGLSSPRTHPAA